jgi:hypothetical protein
VRRFDHPDACLLLLLGNLAMKLFHLGPMQFGSEMVLGVVTVVEPDQVVPFGVGAHSPGNRLVRITVVMEEITVEVSAAMAQIVEGQKEQPEFPINPKPIRMVTPRIPISSSPQRASTGFFLLISL